MARHNAVVPRTMLEWPKRCPSEAPPESCKVRIVDRGLSMRYCERLPVPFLLAGGDPARRDET